MTSLCSLRESRTRVAIVLFDGRAQPRSLIQRGDSKGTAGTVEAGALQFSSSRAPGMVSTDLLCMPLLWSTLLHCGQVQYPCSSRAPWHFWMKAEDHFGNLVELTTIILGLRR
jgi:hypothetical protein